MKKLKLNKETISFLSKKEMNEVKGGETNVVACYVSNLAICGQTKDDPGCYAQTDLKVCKTIEYTCDYTETCGAVSASC